MEEKPGYYTFGDEVKEKSCFVCDKKFTTRLSMLKNCSPNCQQLLLRKLTV